MTLRCNEAGKKSSGRISLATSYGDLPRRDFRFMLFTWFIISEMWDWQYCSSEVQAY